LDHDELVKKVPQTNFLPKLMHNFSPFSKVAQIFRLLQYFKKMQKSKQASSGRKIAQSGHPDGRQGDSSERRKTPSPPCLS
jgi:hypothetical protein